MKIPYKSEHLVIFESELFRTTTTLLLGDDYLLLVDPNWLPGEIAFIDKYIRERHEQKHHLLLFTHSDYDHIIAFGKFRNYQTIASRNFVENPKKESILNQIRSFDDEYYIHREYAIEYPRIDMIIAGDREEIEIGSGQFTFYQAPGHNRDGLLMYESSHKVLIVGDYLSNVEFPFIDYSLADYRETIHKLQTIITKKAVDILITGHGDYTTNQEEMFIRINESLDYLNELEKSIRRSIPFDLESLNEKYKFAGGMRKMHASNEQVVRDELYSRL